MAGFLARFFHKKQEKLNVPDIEGPRRERPYKMKIISVKNEDELSELRGALDDHRLIFVRTPLSLVGSERKSLLSKMKLVCAPAGRHIYGLDLQWYVVTDFERQ